MAGGVLRAGRYEIRNATMVDLVKTAYGVDDDKVLGGPSWLETDRFDVIAKAPAGATADTAKVMLQNLLADRFKLTVHKDNKPLPAYLLAAAKGAPKLKAASGSGQTGCQAPPPSPGPPAPGVIVNIIVSCRNLTMAAFVRPLAPTGERLCRRRPRRGLRPTLEDAWDFDITRTGESLLAAGARRRLHSLTPSTNNSG